jgi:hypothetical protein
VARPFLLRFFLWAFGPGRLKREQTNLAGD